MTSNTRGFTKLEFESRLQRAQNLMDESGIDAMLLTTEPEIRYFTGFHTQFWLSPTRPWFVLVPASGKPVAVVPEIGATVMAKLFVESVRTWESPGEPDRGMQVLAQSLNDMAGARARIGMPMGKESSIRMPLTDLQGLQQSLAHEFVDATDVVRNVRQIKSDNEIDRIRRAAQIASTVFSKADQLFGPGLSLHDVSREFKVAALKEGADDIPYLAIGAGQDGYEDIISLASDQQLVNGDTLMLDTGLTFDGYFCDFDRNFSIGKPSAKITHAYETLWEATEAGLSTARAGVRCQEIFAAMNNVITRAGYPAQANVGRYGHGLGIQLTEWPSVAAFDRTSLQTNMVMTLEPSLTMDNGKCLVAEENIVIGAKSCELLSERATREIPIL